MDVLFRSSDFPLTKKICKYCATPLFFLPLCISGDLGKDDRATLDYII